MKKIHNNLRIIQLIHFMTTYEMLSRGRKKMKSVKKDELKIVGVNYCSTIKEKKILKNSKKIIVFYFYILMISFNFRTY